MSLLEKVFGSAPFGKIVEHTQTVHACVKLIRPLADALIAEDYEAIDRLHHEVSRLEHEADELKDKVRQTLSHYSLMSTGKDDLREYLRAQDDVADAAEDFAVVLRLRRTKLHPALKEDFLAFVDKVIETADQLLDIAEELNVLAESAFAGKEAKRVVERTKQLSFSEWEADKRQRRFAMHYYQIENELDPVTIMMYEKYCKTLGKIANKAETVGKYLRNMVEH